MRAGDEVRHGPTDELWTVGGTSADGMYMTWLGWPPGRARAEDCTMEEECDDEKHIKTLRSILLTPEGRLESRGEHYDLMSYAEREAMLLLTEEEREELRKLHEDIRELEAMLSEMRNKAWRVKLAALRRALQWIAPE